MPEEFAGLAAVVTGAGSGIGRAVTLRLAAGGASVLAVDIRPEAAEATSDEAKQLPGRIVAYQADVTSGVEVLGYVRRCVQEFGGLHLFHNNAGVEGVHKSIVDTTEEEWDRMMAINFRSVFLGLKHTIPAIKESGGGAVVNTGSLLSLKAAPNRSDYVASKHAVLGLTRSAAAEYAKDGIKVNCICPGPIETPLMERSERLVNPTDPEFERRRFEQGTPIGRYGKPEEIAEVVAFLLSPKVPYMTGAAVVVDGGILTI
jgi:NAD(P)-dependent dehydrogenase (short-subunit alcohol dehydrogenase family)